MERYERGVRAVSSRRALTAAVTRWVPAFLRAIAVSVTAYPAVRKFLRYSARVEQFAKYGLPWPAIAVPLTGSIELVAIVSLAFGIAGRLGAAALVAGMLVAIGTAGPNPASVLVLGASSGILLLGTGLYSYWDPTPSEFLDGLKDKPVGRAVTR